MEKNKKIIFQEGDPYSCPPLPAGAHAYVYVDGL